MNVSYYDWIAHHAMRRPEAVAAVNLSSGRRFTYREFDRRIGALAGYLEQACGVGPGMRVAVLAQNTTGIFEVQFACFRLGALFVPLNWRLAVPELDAIVTDCQPAVLIHDGAFASPAQTLAQRHAIAHCLAFDAEDATYERAVAEDRGLLEAYRASLDDPCTILYTSGTTGLPKGSVTTYGMNVWNAVNCTGVAVLSPEAIFLCVAPLFHTGGLNAFANPTFHSGGAVAVMRSFDPGEGLRLLTDPELGVTHFFGVPAHFQFMAQHPDFGATDFSRLRCAYVGAAPTPDVLLETWQARGVLLQQGYGMTETGPVVLTLDKTDAVRKAGSAGKPILHVDVRVVDAEENDTVSGDVGELWVRGPAVTPGYWNNPDATRAAFADDGWLRTGDAVRVDQDGFYFVVDRWKDMFISGGENVYPAEVENVLYRHPAVAEAAVISVPDARWGEVGKAVVIARPGQTLSEADVLAHCAANLARYKVPYSVVFSDALPRTASGKVHKPTLRQQFDRMKT